LIRLLGYSSVAVALFLAVAGTLIAAYTAKVKDAQSRIVQTFTYAIAALLTVATIAMVIGLVTNDFSIGYVAQVGSRSTPLTISIISLWSALEGSILFWGWVLAMYAAIVVWTQRKRSDAAMGYANATLLAVSAFFFLLIVGPANPFELVYPTPVDGPGPNPLLQNHWLMAVHPPLLYLGYVGFTVPFAFAIGTLLSGKVDDDWSKSTRKWTVASWTFLAAAIVAGMWWSYEVLGWGGYWAWDPVENASFMPWLTATAYLHSTMVEERRGMLKAWNVTLIIATFLLTILGTFLTRSGILSSVHSFTAGEIGYYFLAFMGITLIFSLAVLAGRMEALRSDARLDSMVSRESVFLVNNLLLTVFTFTVLLGTMFPLVAEAARGVKVSVGAPFFNKMTLPICLALIFLMGVGPALPWRRGNKEELRKKFIIPAAVGAVVLIVTALLTRKPYVILGFGFTAFALTGNFQEYFQAARARMRSLGENAVTAFGRLFTTNPRRYGGYMAHIGVFLIALGIIASGSYSIDREVTLRAGQTVDVGRYTLTYNETWAKQEPHRFIVGSELVASRNGKVIGTVTPKMNYYAAQAQPIATPAVRSSIRDDLYLTLMAFENDGSKITIRAIVEPLVGWIWVGGLVMMFGGFIALYPAGQRAVRSVRGRRPVRAPQAGALVPEPEPQEAGV
jgi:cytochrome c-type biogenesis protein CcmF